MHMWLIGNGLVIVDVTNPAAPTLKGSYDTVRESTWSGGGGKLCIYDLWYLFS